MRSESDGHCYPRSFPGLAPREAIRRFELTPLVQTACNRYRPSVDEFLRHVDELRGRSRWDESIVADRVERVTAVAGGFELEIGSGTAEGLRIGSVTSCSHSGIPGPPFPPSSRPTNGRFTRTSRMGTRDASRSSAPGWPRRPNG